MDIQRDPTPKRHRRRVVLCALAAALICAVVVLRLPAAPPGVDRSTVWLGTVRRAPMVRQVRGPGTLVPENVRWVSAVVAGRVERILVRPGVTVTAETVLLEMTNPDLQLQLLEAESQLAGAEATLADLRTSFTTEHLTQQSLVATLRAECAEAQRLSAASEALVERRLITALELSRVRDSARELTTRLRLAEDRLQALSAGAAEQVELQRKQIERLRTMATFQRERSGAMQVSAGIEGVVQEIQLKSGQWANSGDVLAKVIEPGLLGAELRIAETRVKDILIGQTAAIDTQNGIVKGKVVRISPAAEQGTITVGISLDGAPPPGARADLRVDGVIDIEHLDDVLQIRKPAYGQDNGVISLFKVDSQGRFARRVTVRLGRSSLDAMEIVDGLREGDAAILSDLSLFDGLDRIELR